jgi:hypothetical protein
MSVSILPIVSENPFLNLHLKKEEAFESNSGSFDVLTEKKLNQYAFPQHY